MDLRSFLFSFDGRINRARYWLANLLCGLSVITLMFVAWKAAGAYYQLFGPPSVPLSFAAKLPVYIAMFPTIAIGTWIYSAAVIKRLHDRNKSGWWALLLVVAPVLLDQFGNALGDHYAATAVHFVALALTIWCFIETFCLRGTRGANRFGPDPLPKTRRGTIFA